MPGESRIADALTRVAETFSRLLVQHLQLLRSEVETEAKGAAAQARAASGAVARAAPFVIAGIALVSLAVAELVAMGLEPWLGRFAFPATALVGGGLEAVVAGQWLRRSLARSLRRDPRSVRTLPDGDSGPSESPDRGNDSQQTLLHWRLGGTTTSTAPAPMTLEEKYDGSVG